MLKKNYTKHCRLFFYILQEKNYIKKNYSIKCSKYFYFYLIIPSLFLSFSLHLADQFLLKKLKEIKENELNDELNIRR